MLPGPRTRRPVPWLRSLQSGGAGRRSIPRRQRSSASTMRRSIADSCDTPSRKRSNVARSSRAREERATFERFLDGVSHESAIERRMVLAELRCRLGIERRPAPPDWSERSHGTGRLVRGPGSIPIVHLEGTPEERGEQHGKLLGNEARALAESYLRGFLGRRELDKARHRARELFEPHLTEGEKAELAAFSKASKIS